MKPSGGIIQRSSASVVFPWLNTLSRMVYLIVCSIVDMEREGYRKQIDELIRGMQALLDANNAMGERLKNLERIAEDYEGLKAEHEKLKGQLEYRKRAQYGKVSEKKPTDNPPSDKDVTKDDEKEEFIEQA